MFKPSQVSTARYLSITALITIKVAYDHTRIVYTCVVCWRVEGLTARNQLLVRQGVNHPTVLGVELGGPILFELSRTIFD
jgi:hypothetical protein